MRRAFLHQAAGVLPVERITPAQSAEASDALSQQVGSELLCFCEPCLRAADFVQVQERQGELRVRCRKPFFSDKQSSDRRTEHFHREDRRRQECAERMLAVVQAPREAPVPCAPDVVRIVARVSGAFGPCDELLGHRPEFADAAGAILSGRLRHATFRFETAANGCMRPTICSTMLISVALVRFPGLEGRFRRTSVTRSLTSSELSSSTSRPVWLRY